MEFIDTHAHLYLEAFQNDIEGVMERAKEAGVHSVVLPNIDSQTHTPLQILCRKYPGRTFPLMGLHPTHVKENYRDELNQVFEAFESSHYYGVGEIGIDLYWDKTHVEEQKTAFKEQVKYALSRDLPVVIHARESIREILECLSESDLSGARGIFHAFTGTADEAGEIISRGFKLGIGGIVTFKNSGLDRAIASIDPEHLVLETDSPYLAPVPYRGKRNESAYVPLVAEKLSEIFAMSIEDIAALTTATAKQVFGI